MSAPEENLPLLDATIRTDQVPNAGRDLAVAAKPEQLEALAERLLVTSVENLSAKLHIVRFRGGIRVTGNVLSRIVQPCVVTFEPVTQDIDEPVDRVFLPGVDRHTAQDGDADIFVDPEGEDDPDHFDGIQADLSELLVEAVALAIDPYPRAPGASLDTIADPIDDGPISPFSGLKVLKNPGNDG